MPPLSDPAAIRAILHTDAAWSVYPLGDLAPQLFERARWFRSANIPPALVLLYSGFDPPVLFALGPGEQVRPLLDELDHDGDLFLHVRPDILPALGERYKIDNLDLMWRMTLPPDAYRPVPTDEVVRLARTDLPALEQLYADGAATGESPHFFLPSMVQEGVFVGIREGTELVAAAGTHLVVPAEGVAAVGCIYTRRDRRGRGLATRVTAAVVSELLLRGIATVALNVRQSNVPAIRVYERLGFVRYCAYYEGLAQQRLPSDGGNAP